MSLFRAVRASLVEAPPARETERRDLVLPGDVVVPLVQVRDRRSRRLRLTVSERGVRLSVPWRLSARASEAFVHEHLPWIAAQWARFRDVRAPVAWGFGVVQTLPLAGVEWPVDWVEARSARLERRMDARDVALLDGLADAHAVTAALRFHAPRHASPASLRRAVLEFYATEARAAVHRWLPTYLPDLPRPPRQFRLRPLSSLWGSLAPDGTVSLDLALALGPPAAFEYVLVHELCHLIHANHAAPFWHEVEARCPGWRAQRAFLRGEAGLALKGTLRALAAA